MYSVLATTHLAQVDILTKERYLIRNMQYPEQWPWTSAMTEVLEPGPEVRIAAMIYCVLP